MKTKGTKFIDMKKMLSRDELRQIKGGSGYYTCICSYPGPPPTGCTNMTDSQIAGCYNYGSTYAVLWAPIVVTCHPQAC